MGSASASCIYGTHCSSLTKWGALAARFNDSCENADRVLRGADSLIGVWQNGALLQGRQVDASMTAVSEHIRITRGTLAVFRAIPTLVKIFTLKIIWMEGPDGKRVHRPWVKIILDILVTVARLLTPLYWLHKLRALDLGKSAQSVSITIIGIWTAVITLSFVNSVKEFLVSTKENLSKRTMQLLTDFGDFVAMPWDFGFLSQTPSLAFIGSIVTSVSSALCLWNETV